jgi:hypothetical protein
LIFSAALCVLSRRISKVILSIITFSNITRCQIESLEDSKSEMEDIITAADETIGSTVLLIL